MCFFFKNGNRRVKTDLEEGRKVRKVREKEMGRRGGGREGAGV